jgi:hypothetical protein
MVSKMGSLAAKCRKADAIVREEAILVRSLFRCSREIVCVLDVREIDASPEELQR